MDNRQDNIGNERSQALLQFRKDDFYNYGAIDNDGFHYTLAMHKSARLLLFAKVAENVTESQMGGDTVSGWMLIQMADIRFWIRIMQQK
jgi:hypothetical protein